MVRRDPIWLGCQSRLMLDYYMEDVASVSSYHT
jgi:hypothetical protein